LILHLKVLEALQVSKKLSLLKNSLKDCDMEKYQFIILKHFKKFWIY